MLQERLDIFCMRFLGRLCKCDAVPVLFRVFGMRSYYVYVTSRPGPLLYTAIMTTHL